MQQYGPTAASRSEYLGVKIFVIILGHAALDDESH
jgi:hypothetical protein